MYYLFNSRLFIDNNHISYCVSILPVVFLNQHNNPVKAASSKNHYVYIFS